MRFKTNDAPRKGRFLTLINGFTILTLILCSSCGGIESEQAPNEELSPFGLESTPPPINSSTTSSSAFQCGFLDTVDEDLQIMDEIFRMRDANKQTVLGTFPSPSPGFELLPTTPGGASVLKNLEMNWATRSVTAEFYLMPREYAPDYAYSPFENGDASVVAKTMNELLPIMMTNSAPGFSEKVYPNVPCFSYTQDICNLMREFYCETVELRDAPAVSGYFVGVSPYKSIVQCKLKAPCSTKLRREYPAAIRSSKGFYLTAVKGGGGPVMADKKTLGRYETFGFTFVNPTQIGLKTYMGKYVSALDGGGQMVYATGNSIGKWETFTIFDSNPNALILNTQKGIPLMAIGGGGSWVLAVSTVYEPAYTFKLDFLGHRL